MEEERVPIDVPLVLLSTFIRQCTSPYATGVYRVKEPSGATSYVYTEAGDVCISADPVPPPHLPQFDVVITLNAYGKSRRHPDLQRLTTELKAITESAAGITIDGFQITWGVWDTEPLPFLMYARGTASGGGNLTLLTQQLLCIAIEMTVSPVEGKCITPDRNCFAPTHIIDRRRVVGWRVLHFFGSDADVDTMKRVMARLEEIDPKIATARVKCCQHCYNMYTRTVRPATGTGSRARSRAPSTKSREPPPPEPPLPALKKTKSGLSMNQQVSIRTEYKARALYGNVPFPKRRHR